MLSENTCLPQMACAWTSDVCPCLTEISSIGVLNKSMNQREAETEPMGHAPFPSCIMTSLLSPTFPWENGPRRCVPSEPEPFVWLKWVPLCWNQPFYCFLGPNSNWFQNSSKLKKKNLKICMHFGQKDSFCLRFLKLSMWQNCIFILFKMILLMN